MKRIEYVERDIEKTKKLLFDLITTVELLKSYLGVEEIISKRQIVKKK